MLRSGLRLAAAIFRTHARVLGLGVILACVALVAPAIADTEWRGSIGRLLFPSRALLCLLLAAAAYRTHERRFLQLVTRPSVRWIAAVAVAVTLTVAGELVIVALDRVVGSPQSWFASLNLFEELSLLVYGTLTRVVPAWVTVACYAGLIGLWGAVAIVG